MAEDKIRQEILSAMSAFELPEYRLIPDVGLFLEQVVRYTGEFMKPVNGQTLTGSMISNYVKHKIIANPVKKQYDRDRIAMLLFIMVAKNVLSLEDIQLLLSMQKDTCSVEAAYEYFRKELMYGMSHVQEIGNGINCSANDDGNGGADPAGADDAENANKKLLLKTMIVTVVHKFYLDLYFAGVRGN